MPEAAPSASDITLVVQADPAAVRDGLAHLLARPPLVGLDGDDRSTVELVLAEVLNNVAEHAYSGQGGLAEVTLGRTRSGLFCLVSDRGQPMPAGQLPAGQLHEGTSDDPADLPEGGFGWHLIRSLTRDLAYVRRDGQNRLSFVVPLGG